MEKHWTGEVSVCDICGCVLKDFFIDGKMKGHTAWAIMCPKCHEEYGVGLGDGLGQRYPVERKEIAQ